jgi:predicted O-methyltransferase YrrM
VIFIDADKENLPQYFEWAIKLSHRGSLIIADNVVRDGEVINDASDDPKVIAVRQFYEMLSTDRRVDATAIQTVGVKGYDGFAIARVNFDP